jgi:hypothetical protein
VLIIFVCIYVTLGEADDIDPNLQKENVLNNPLLEDGTFLYMATKVRQLTFLLSTITVLVKSTSRVLSH